SIVIRLTHGRVSFLFTGDLQEEGEEVLLIDDPAIVSTALKVAHHGSLDATSERFLQEVRPRWAIISAGRNNPFGHPHEQTLERLGQTGAKVFRTDESGTIEMISDGKCLEAKWGRGYQRWHTVLE
ncbi:MAG: MBL fold metallo-hydrolase, partial [Armatimonadetes bacterium]|nr:MBL fold metallo-hydrolase [Armatimonadota bacterium]NIM24402.1 MBL fold metallo-hydrolase [Armatimonadota bacterium]NIM68273.1 MBL fold metallo-hydrolase [Armatimonadota bacterium]NIM76677.1 MBL fold metallo-hydrolase [Armatimonadota bacterium]NIN06476.1 MBL fold metallo-hydrolase [Armatimonadota bacterium]